MLPVALVLAFVSAASRPPTVRPGSQAPSPSVEASYAYDLSTPSGPAALTWPSLAYDRAHDELFVVAEGFVRIFDSTGMEVYRFGDDGALGNITRVAVLDDDHVVVMTTLDGKRAFLRCDFRGDLVEPLSLTALPRSLAGFDPDQLVQRNGKLYFAERSTMRVVVTDEAGAFRESFQLRDVVAAAVVGDSERRPAASLDGFNVDTSGNLLFTMSTMFAVGSVSPVKILRMFGSRGSTPGKFNIVGAVDTDEVGNVFVTDRLRSVVSVWSRDLRHLGDFGYRGDSEMSLLTPYEIAVGNGKVFVAQAGKRGVKVFRVRLVEPLPAPGPTPPATPAPPARPQRGQR
jgi:hypothetical protein